VQLDAGSRARRCLRAVIRGYGLRRSLTAERCAIVSTRRWRDGILDLSNSANVDICGYGVPDLRVTASSPTDRGLEDVSLRGHVPTEAPACRRRCRRGHGCDLADSRSWVAFLVNAWVGNAVFAGLRRSARPCGHPQSRMSLRRWRGSFGLRCGVPWTRGCFRTWMRCCGHH